MKEHKHNWVPIKLLIPDTDEWILIERLDKQANFEITTTTSSTSTIERVPTLINVCACGAYMRRIAEEVLE